MPAVPSRIGLATCRNWKQRTLRVLSQEMDQCNRWLREARSGSEEALDRLIEAISDQLWREIGARRNRRGMGPSQGLSDLVQDTLVRVREGFFRFREGNFSEFKQWVRTILFRRWQELARNHHTRTSEEQKHRIWMALVERGITRRTDDTDAFEAEEEHEKAARLMGLLRPHERNIIQLRLVHGLKFGEIAKSSGWTEDAARMAFTRAIERLREIYEANGT